MKIVKVNNHTLINADCLDAMEYLISIGTKVDAVITDPPYGVLNKKCEWDNVIDLDIMWKFLHKLQVDDRVPVVLFSQEPYTSNVIFSNLKDFKYKWYWEKTQATGFLNANKQPLRCIEEICVFYSEQCKYNPQKSEGHAPTHNRVKRAHIANKSIVYGNNTKDIAGGGNTDRFPRQLLTYKSDKQTEYTHPTQKPKALMKYLIETYTDEGDTVLDFTMGSGTTGVACAQCKRNFIGIEIDKDYFDVAKKRIELESQNQYLF